MVNATPGRVWIFPHRKRARRARSTFRFNCNPTALVRLMSQHPGPRAFPGRHLEFPQFTAGRHDCFAAANGFPRGAATTGTALMATANRGFEATAFIDGMRFPGSSRHQTQIGRGHCAANDPITRRAGGGTIAILDQPKADKRTALGTFEIVERHDGQVARARSTLPSRCLIGPFALG